MSEPTQVRLDHSGPHATLTFHSANGVNVASLPFLADLERALDTLERDRAVRFVTVNATGKVFLAGADIKAMVDYDAGKARTMAETGHRVFDKLEALPQVTVAAIHGACLGGGCELAMACDFRFAVAHANIGQPEVLLGLIPGWGGTARLPRLVAHNVARRMMITGDSIKGEDAHAVGLVDRLVRNAEDFDSAIAEFFDDLVKTGPAAVAAVKRVLRGAGEVEAFAACFDGAEAGEGMRAFLDRRPATWSA